MQYSSGLSFADVSAAEVYGKGQAERTGPNQLRKGDDMVWYIVFRTVRCYSRCESSAVAERC
jgi:hypothetical protein